MRYRGTDKRSLKLTRREIRGDKKISDNPSEEIKVRKVKPSKKKQAKG